MSRKGSKIVQNTQIKATIPIWIELRQLKTNPILLVPGWTDVNIIIRRNAVIVESNIIYLGTIDSPATDLKKQLLKSCVEHPKYMID